jgi:hypothetical protein
MRHLTDGGESSHKRLHTLSSIKERSQKSTPSSPLAEFSFCLSKFQRL